MAGKREVCFLILLQLITVTQLVSPVRALFNLTVIHTNDVHARFVEFNNYGGRCPPEESEAGKCFGGFARQITKAREMRDAVPNLLYLNGGDFYQGTIWYSLYRHEVMSTFVNKLGLDAMALGNHEFDDGLPGLIPFLQKAAFPVLCCNYDATLVPEFEKLVNKSVVMTVGDQKIGIIGYLTPDTSFLSSPGDLILTDEVDCIQKEAKRLKSQDIKIIIAVGHSGFTKDQEIAKRVEEVDIVIGGHTDTFLYSGIPPSTEKPEGPYPVVVDHEDGSKALVVQDYTFGKYLGNLWATFDTSGQVKSYGGNPMLLDSTVEQEPAVLAELMKWSERVTEQGESVVGRTSVLLRGERSLCRMRECNMGNFLTDAALYYYISTPTARGWNSVAVAVWNSGGIRASIDERINKGNITMEDVMTVAPFQNTMDVLSMSGSSLKEMLETSVFNYDRSAKDPPGAFLQVSGIRVRYDVSQPPGQRVVDLSVRCSECRVPRYLPLNESSLYSVVVPAYMAMGGDNFTVLTQVTNRYITGMLDTDIIVEYLKKESPVTAELENRITFGPVMSVEECNASNSLVFNNLYIGLVVLLFLLQKNINSHVVD